MGTSTAGPFRLVISIFLRSRIGGLMLIPPGLTAPDDYLHFRLGLRGELEVTFSSFVRRLWL